MTKHTVKWEKREILRLRIENERLKKKYLVRQNEDGDILKVVGMKSMAVAVSHGNLISVGVKMLVQMALLLY